MFTDIDECNVGTHNCSQVCTNTGGSFDCSCQIGNSGTGNNCTGEVLYLRVYCTLICLFVSSSHNVRGTKRYSCPFVCTSVRSFICPFVRDCLRNASYTTGSICLYFHTIAGIKWLSKQEFPMRLVLEDVLSLVCFRERLYKASTQYCKRNLLFASLFFLISRDNKLANNI